MHLSSYVQNKMERMISATHQPPYKIPRPQTLALWPGDPRHGGVRRRNAVCCLADMHVDVVVVGAGIVGLSTAATLLQQRPRLSVAIVDSAEPCAGATGAGDLINTSPHTVTCPLNRRWLPYLSSCVDDHSMTRLLLSYFLSPQTERTNSFVSCVCGLGGPGGGGGGGSLPSLPTKLEFSVDEMRHVCQPDVQGKSNESNVIGPLICLYGCCRAGLYLAGTSGDGLPGVALGGIQQGPVAAHVAQTGCHLHFWQQIVWVCRPVAGEASSPRAQI